MFYLRKRCKVSNPKWEIGLVKLANGNEAIIDAINEDQEDYRYTGRVRGPRGIMVSTGWHADGRYMYAETDHGHNLAPPPKKTVRVRCWLNVYSDGTVNRYWSRLHADNSIGVTYKRIACIEINREVAEGEGL